MTHKSDPKMVFIVMQGFILHSKKDLRIYGVYPSRARAEKAVKSIGTKQAHPVYEGLEGPGSPVPPSILEIPFNSHPDHTAFRDDCHLRFKEEIGLETFWTKEEYERSSSSGYRDNSETGKPARASELES